MAKTVVKASGRQENFDFGKLVESLVRSGAPRDVAASIAGRVEVQISPLSHSKHIFRLARKMLRQYSHASGMKYSIKKALSALGPSGYPFEKYFGKILSNHGYGIELNQVVEGYCVRHEVDVVAEKDSERFVIECKFHSEAGKAVDVKIALYVHSRVADIQKRAAAGASVKQGWLVTNTRCTLDAIRYAECSGLRIVSWRYPEEGSLEKMIESRRLYPVTILTSVKRQSLDLLFKNDIVIVQDIADMTEGEFASRSGLDRDTALLLKREADRICNCS